MPQSHPDHQPQSRHGIICRLHGRQGLTSQAYNKQMSDPNSLWRCPCCGRNAQWDDDRYEAAARAQAQANGSSLDVEEISGDMGRLLEELLAAVLRGDKLVMNTDTAAPFKKYEGDMPPGTRLSIMVEDSLPDGVILALQEGVTLETVIRQSLGISSDITLN